MLNLSSLVFTSKSQGVFFLLLIQIVNQTDFFNLRPVKIQNEQRNSKEARLAKDKVA